MLYLTVVCLPLSIWKVSSYKFYFFSYKIWIQLQEIDLKLMFQLQTLLKLQITAIKYWCFRKNNYPAGYRSEITRKYEISILQTTTKMHDIKRFAIKLKWPQNLRFSFLILNIQIVRDCIWRKSKKSRA